MMKVKDTSARKPRRHAILVQLPLLLALVAFWLVLWGHVDVISVVTGIIFSVIIVEVFYLPAVDLSGRINLWWTLVFFVKFVYRLVSASLIVAWLAVRPAKPPLGSVISVQLRTRSDFILTLTAEVNMLIPGSMVVEVDRMHSVLYLHVLDASTDESVESVKALALDVEEGLALALGTRDDLWRVNRDRVRRGLGPIGQSPAQKKHEAIRDKQFAHDMPVIVKESATGRSAAQEGDK